jgi:DNA invertase Pin-like site-specific DNA recombinase
MQRQPDPALQGLARCKKVLHYCAEWQQGFATMRFGYARVSTQEQDTALQIGALEAAGCERVFQEKASGGRWDRPELHRLFDHLRKGDVLVVWKLDRLSRSLKDLLLILEKLKGAGADFQSLTEAIDTATPAGRMMMQIVGSFAEFERAMLRERTRTGLDAARQEGRVGGRRPKLSPQQQKEVIDLVQSGRKTGADAARLFRVHPSTVARLLAKAGRCRDTGDYKPVLFEWYKFVGSLCFCVVHLRPDSPAYQDIPRQNYYVLVGLLNRCARLMLSNVALSHEGKFGETTAIVDRCIFESSVKIIWLCHSTSNSDEEFTRYLADGLKTELEFKARIEADIAANGGTIMPIQERMLRSIDNHIAASGLTPDGIRSAKKQRDLAAFFVAFRRAGRLSLGHAAAPDRPRPRCPLHHLRPLRRMPLLPRQLQRSRSGRRQARLHLHRRSPGRRLAEPFGGSGASPQAGRRPVAGRGSRSPAPPWRTAPPPVILCRVTV